MSDLFDYSGSLPRFLTAEEWLERNPDHAYLSTVTPVPADETSESATDRK